MNNKELQEYKDALAEFPAIERGIPNFAFFMFLRTYEKTIKAALQDKIDGGWLGVDVRDAPPEDCGRYLIKTSEDKTYIGTYFKIHDDYTLDHDLEFMIGEEVISILPLPTPPIGR